MGPNEVNGVYHLIVCLFSANEKQEIKITHPPYLFCYSSNVILKKKTSIIILYRQNVL